MLLQIERRGCNERYDPILRQEGEVVPLDIVQVQRDILAHIQLRHAELGREEAGGDRSQLCVVELDIADRESAGFQNDTRLIPIPTDSAIRCRSVSGCTRLHPRSTSQCVGTLPPT